MRNTASSRRTYEQSYVRTLFDDIAGRYDVVNRLLSSGVDVVWRRRLIGTLREFAPQEILDVATGTADVALAACALRPRRIVGIDISANMLAVGRDKIRRRGKEGIITLVEGPAEHLPFADGTFDAVTAAFGVRNFEDLQGGLAEMARVVRPGGVAAILEFSRPRTPGIAQAYRWYSRTLLPWLGGFISRNRRAYEYLPSTVAEFPDGEEFLDILRSVGFVRCRQRRLTFGIATIYTAEKETTRS